MNAKRIAAFAVVLTMMASVFAFTPPASAYGRYGGIGVRVYAPLPPIRHERLIVRPGPRYVWVPGYWRWEGRRYGWVGGNYVWVAGSWVRPPHEGAVWVAPRYEERGSHHIYHRGQWRDRGRRDRDHREGDRHDRDHWDQG